MQSLNQNQVKQPFYEECVMSFHNKKNNYKIRFIKFYKTSFVMIFFLIFEFEKNINKIIIPMYSRLEKSKPLVSYRYNLQAKLNTKLKKNLSFKISPLKVKIAFLFLNSTYLF